MKAMDDKIDELKYSLQFSQSETTNEINILKEQHRSEINGLKDKIREIEDRSQHNNSRVAGLNESENEDWPTTKRNYTTCLKINLVLQRRSRLKERIEFKDKKENQG